MLNKCPKCNGTGKNKISNYGRFISISKTCEICDGIGKLDKDFKIILLSLHKYKCQYDYNLKLIDVFSLQENNNSSNGEREIKALANHILKCIKEAEKK